MVYLVAIYAQEVDIIENNPKMADNNQIRFGLQLNLPRSTSSFDHTSAPRTLHVTYKQVPIGGELSVIL